MVVHSDALPPVDPDRSRNPLATREPRSLFTIAATSNRRPRLPYGITSMRIAELRPDDGDQLGPRPILPAKPDADHKAIDRATAAVIVAMVLYMGGHFAVAWLAGRL